MTAALVLLLVIDWWQTLRIARNPQRWYERNPVLGEHPEPLRVHAWFALCAVAAVCLRFCPHAQALAIAWIGAEVVCVVNNWRLGIR